MTLTATPAAPLVLLDPTGEVETGQATGAARARDLAGGTLGQLDNSMGWSHVVLDELGAILRARYGVAEVVKARRPNLSRPTPTPMLEDLVRRADFVVAGCGV